MKKILFILIIVVSLAGCSEIEVTPPISQPPANQPQESVNTTGLDLKIPDGFKISNFAEGLENPRVLNLDDAGQLLTSVTSKSLFKIFLGVKQ